jgi:hypothetical protein
MILKKIAGNGYRSQLANTQEETMPNKKLLPYPFFLLFSVIAFNFTAFSVLLQMDFLIFNSTIFKVIAWLATAGSWSLAYIFRNK